MAKDKSKILYRSAQEVKRYRVLMKLIPIISGALVCVVAMVYVVSVMYNRYGAFTATINKFDNIDYSLSLSETPQFDNATSRLNAKANEDITNISKNDLPSDIDMINGTHNGDNYIAYTFYLKNTGNKEIKYEYELYIANCTNNVDKAMRVRLYVNGVPTDYARTKTDGTGAEEGTTEFLTTSSIVKQRVDSFSPEAISKYTVVIWLEGDDPDCTDSLIGGQFKVDMKFSILNIVNPAD